MEAASCSFSRACPSVVAALSPGCSWLRSRRTHQGGSKPFLQQGPVPQLLLLQVLTSLFQTLKEALPVVRYHLQLVARPWMVGMKATASWWPVGPRALLVFPQASAFRPIPASALVYVECLSLTESQCSVLRLGQGQQTKPPRASLGALSTGSCDNT